MPSRTWRWVVARFSEPFPPAALVGWAVGLGLVPLLVRVPVEDAGPLAWGKVAFVLLFSTVGGVMAAVAAFLAQYMGGVVRRFAVRHRRVAWTVSTVAAGVALLLAVAGAVALGWSGEPVGDIATDVVKAVCAFVVGTLSGLLSLGWTLANVRRRAVRRLAVALCLYLSVACFLFFEHRPPGGTLVVVALIVSFLWTAVMRATPAAPGVILGCALLFTVFAVEENGVSGGTAARVLVQAVIAVAMGTVTVLFVLRLAAWHGRLLRFAGATAIVPLAYVVFLWFDGQLLGGPLEAPLFVPMAWLVVRLWRRMQADSRTAVSAAADIVFAVLIGTVLVLFLVWLANVLDLPVAEVRALRGAAAHLGDLIDLPWWTWAGVDVLLVAAFLAAALRPRRFRRITGALGRIRLPGGLAVLRRALSVLKIVLLGAVFLGLAGPPAVGPVLSRHIRDRYRAELQQELDARGEAALYQEIGLRFARSPQALPVLTQMLVEVYDSTRHSSGEGGPSPAARDLAHRMGELQARTLLPYAFRDGADPARHATEPPTAAAVGQAGMNGAAADAADLAGRLTREQDEAADADAREHEAEQAAEHAAAVVTAAVGNLTFGHGVVIGLVREYLDGLADSGLRNVFLRWTDRALPRTSPAEAPAEPPAASQLVEPVPDALQAAADDQLTEELIATGVRPGTDPAQSRADHDSPLAAAVHLAAHTRALQHGTAHCADCVHFVEPGGGEHGGEDVGGFHGE